MWKTLWFGLVLLGLGFGGYFGYRFYSGWPRTDLRQVIEDRLEREKTTLASLVPKVLDMRPAIDRDFAPIVSTAAGEDAGQYLNHKIPWIIDETNAATKAAYASYLKDHGPSSSSLTLPMDVVARLNRPGVFPAQAATFDYKALDFGWMKEIKRFQYWDINDNSPTELLPRIDFATAPVPDLFSLIAWSKLRMMKTQRDGDLSDATDEVLHLAKLMHSTESVVGQIASLNVISIAQAFAGTRPDLAHLKPAAFDRGRIYADSLFHLMSHPALSAADLTRLLAIDHGPAFCGAFEAAARSMFYSRSILEPVRSARYQALRDALKTKTACRLRHVRRAWAGEAKFAASSIDLAMFKSTKARRATLEQTKTAFTGVGPNSNASDFKKLEADVRDPQWPMLWTYAILLTDPDAVFARLRGP